MNSPPTTQIRHLLDQRSAHVAYGTAYEDGELDTPSIYSHAYFSPAPDHLRSPSPTRSSQGDRNRLNDLAVSMLELDEEPISEHDSGDSEEEDLPRMSMLGPKMRFHSKAPWEELETALEEDEADMIIRQHQFQPRASTESYQTSISNKRSFETTSTHSSYIRSMHEGSVSSTSLIAPPRKASLFGKIPSRSVSPQTSPISSRAPASMFSSKPSSILSRSDDTHISPFSSSEEQSHPYANTDYAVAEPSPRTPQQPSIPFPSSSVSVPIVTELPPSSSMSPRSHVSVQGREISSPILRSLPNSAAPNSEILTATPTLTSWNGGAPSFNLISLEEARSQRTRSASAQVPAPRSSTGPYSSFPHPEDQSGRQSPTNSIATRSRARSISAGVRALHNIVGSSHPPKLERHESDSSPISPKSLKNKKSAGFLRLFNGNTREVREVPPPVPSLSEGFAAFNASQSHGVVNKPLKPQVQRIPVPSLGSLGSLGDLSPISSSGRPSPSFSKRSPPPPLSIHTAPSMHFPKPPASAVDESFKSRLGVVDDQVPQSAPANVTQFPALRLRPISTMFSAHFADHLIPRASSPDADSETQGSISPATVVSPVTPAPFSLRVGGDQPVKEIPEQEGAIRELQEQMAAAKKAWQRHIWELEGQVRDLKTEVEDLRMKGRQQQCGACGKLMLEKSEGGERQPAVAVTRPRARTRTGTSSRFEPLT